MYYIYMTGRWFLKSWYHEGSPQIVQDLGIGGGPTPLKHMNATWDDDSEYMGQ